MLKSFAPKDRAEMVKDDKVVNCEFCSSVYDLAPPLPGTTSARARWSTLAYVEKVRSQFLSLRHALGKAQQIQIVLMK